MKKIFKVTSPNGDEIIARRGSVLVDAYIREGSWRLTGNNRLEHGWAGESDVDWNSQGPVPGPNYVDILGHLWSEDQLHFQDNQGNEIKPSELSCSEEQAFRAITARISGVWDDPDLQTLLGPCSLGPLADIERIIHNCLARSRVNNPD